MKHKLDNQFVWSVRLGNSECSLCNIKQYKSFYELNGKCVCESCFKYAHALFEQGELFHNERIYMKLNRIIFGD